MLRIANWDHLEIRDEKYFIFWAEYPYWVVVNQSLYEILKILRSGVERNIEALASDLGIDHDKLSNTLNPLLKSGVIYYDEAPPNVAPAPSSGFVEENVGITGFTFHLTKACNLRCKHCYAEAGLPSEDELTASEFRKILEDALPYMNAQRKEVGLLGGEPLLVQDKFFEIASWAFNTQTYACGTSTNATLVTHEIARKAKDLRIVFQVSFEGATEASNDRIRGKGHFRRAVEAVEILRKEGVVAGIIMTIRQDNIHEIPGFLKLGVELNASFIRTNFLKIQGRAEKYGLKMGKQLDILRLTYDAVRNDKQLQEKMAFSTAGFIFSAMRLRPKYRNCGSGLTVPLIDSNGDVYPCQTLFLPEFKLGNVRKASIVDIWFGNPNTKKLRELCVDTLNPKCSKCWLRYLCHGGCRGLTYNLTGSLSAPDVRCEDFQRAYAEAAFIMGEDPDAFAPALSQFATFLYPDIINPSRSEKNG